MDKQQKDWFEEWFDSPYYDLLYSKRDEEEAAFFIDNLLNYIPITHRSVLDVACGKGRHSVYFHQKGYEVVGTDLSKRKIAYAKQSEQPGLEFAIQDMRDPLQGKQFGLIVNLFTSFGYFEDVQDNIKVLRAVKDMLLPDGTFVLDYFNGQKLVSTLVRLEEQKFPNAHFLINRKVEYGYVVKDIELRVGDSHQYFKEKVRLFDLEEFRAMFKEAGLKIQHEFGDYDLHPFDAATSNRIIFIATH